MPQHYMMRTVLLLPAAWINPSPMTPTDCKDKN